AESAGGGLDTVMSSVNFTLPSEVEDLVLTGSAAMGTGNGLANHLTGSAAANTLDGAGGSDVLTGGAGNDVVVFHAGEAQGDVVTDFVGNGAAAGDSLRFVGYGPGATLTEVGSSDSWQVTANGGTQTEVIQLAGVTTLHPTDYVFT